MNVWAYFFCVRQSEMTLEIVSVIVPRTQAAPCWLVYCFLTSKLWVSYERAVLSRSDKSATDVIYNAS